MKTICLAIAIMLLNGAQHAYAQVLQNIDKKIEQKVNQRINQNIDKGIDKGLDKIENGAKQSTKSNGSSGTSSSQTSTPSKENNTSSSSAQTFNAQSKFDFVPGDKVIAVEDFSQDAVGDFPLKWNTDGSAEIMNINIAEGKWLGFTRSCALTPEFINSLPENFTLEFDVAVSPNYSFYDGSLGIALAALSNKNDFTAWKLYGDARRAGQTGIMTWLHPQDAGSPPVGHSKIEVWENGKKIMSNATGNLTSFNRNKNLVHIAIWRQNQRLRIYLGEEKIWDLPKAFTAGSKYNTVVFSRYDAKDDHNFFITNIRLAAGNPDTRHKLIEEGKFSTSGIYFNTGSAQIKPESHGVIKEIAGLLKEYPDLKINITGHTDNVGNAAANQQLSEQRAASVREYLNKTFGIDNSRMTTSGKGASVPVADNKTPEGKAQNRRVEFIRQ